jgi:hypothetical protein
VTKAPALKTVHLRVPASTQDLAALELGNVVYLTGRIFTAREGVYKKAVEGRRWSGRIEARTGLRMMPTFPRSPLRFRKAGFPRYGSKAGLSDRAFPDHPSVKLAPSMPVA